MGRVVQPAVISGLTAVVVVAGFGVAIVSGLREPPPLLPQFAAPAAPQPSAAPDSADADPDGRAYVAVPDSVLVTLPGFGSTLRLDLGLAVDPAAARALRTVLANAPETVSAPLAGAVMEAAETLDPAIGWAGLRAALPTALLPLVNDRIEAVAGNRPVHEILILGFATGG